MASYLYREEPVETLDRLCKTSLDDTIESYRLLPGGMFNTTYFLHTRGHGEVVLRLGAVNRHLLMPFELHLMEAEAEVYRRCRQLDLPVPEILHLDLSGRIVDRGAMFTRYVPGVAMSCVRPDEENYKELCRALGVFCARMHTLTADRFGRVYDVMHGGGHASWHEAIEAELSAWERVAVPATILDAPVLSRVEKAIGRAAPILDAIRVPTLVHNDLWMGNVLLTQEEKSYRLGLVLDGDRAMYADPELEFSGHRVIHDEPSFCYGYGKAPAQTPDAVLRRGLYHMLTQMWHSYVFRVEYGMPAHADRAAGLVRGELERLEARLDGVSREYHFDRASKNRDSKEE